MLIGWLTPINRDKLCIQRSLLLPVAGKPALASLIFNLPCPSADGQIPIASVVISYFRKKKKDMQSTEEYFKENCYKYDRDYICELNERDNGPINNVLSHLEEHCFGIQIFEKNGSIEYEIFYVDYKNDLKGYGLLLSLDLELNTRTEYTTGFCKLLNKEFPHVDRIDTFNSFQSQTRAAFEKYGFFTFGNEIEMFEGKNAIGILPLGCKGHLFFPTINKLGIYRWLFNEEEDYVKIDESKTKKIYLILDSENNIIKIGQSYYPKIREKTLQGVSPHWDIITTWIAPASVERDLHEKFKHKRTRGEWFKLDFSDLEEIKKHMKEYKNSL